MVVVTGAVFVFCTWIAATRVPGSSAAIFQVRTT
jgi:hypothetical protein